MAAASFPIYVFEDLQKGLEKINELRSFSPCPHSFMIYADEGATCDELIEQMQQLENMFQNRL